MQRIPTTLTRFFWHIVKPYKKWLVVPLLVEVLWALEVSAVAYVLKYIIDTLAAFEGPASNILPIIIWPACFYIGLWATDRTINRVGDCFGLLLYPTIRKDVIITMFSYLEGHSLDYFQNHFAGSLQNKISDLADGIIVVFQRVQETLGTVFMAIIAITTMIIVQPIFGLILFIWLVIFLSFSIFYSKNIVKLSNIYSESRTTLVGKIVDSIGNIMHSALFARRTHEIKMITDVTNDIRSKARKMRWGVLKMRIICDISVVCMIGLMLFALIFLYRAGSTTIGDFTFVITLTVAVINHVWWISNQFVDFSENLGKCKQALTIITVPHEITDKPNAKPLHVTKGRIAFEDVTFYYNKGTNVFENKNIVIESGQKVGLVGFSGGGKSTFVNLILRFFDVKSGMITIDGQNIKEVTRSSLRENISMIPQDTSLFHRTLMENIRYGRLDASDEEVIKASKKAHCHEFITQMPKEYEALVGERGIKLSGGQRQRVAIARAMLKHAPILILDEATSSLDSVTEKYIQEGFHDLMKGCTTIVIAHRLSTLAEMDKILVFDKGHIIESGTHRQLLQKKGHYSQYNFFCILDIMGNFYCFFVFFSKWAKLKTIIRD